MIRVWGHNRDSINPELLYQIMGEDLGSLILKKEQIEAKDRKERFR